MTTSGPELQGRSRILQSAQLVLAALAAIVIAVAAQGWPVSEPYCEGGTTCDGA